MEKDLKGKHIQVAGLGKSGRGAAILGHYLQARVSVTDKKSVIEPDLSDLQSKEIEIHQGSERLLPDVDILIASPGIPPDNKIITEAKTQKIPVIGEMEFSSRYCTVPIIGITGTDGKSSVVTMVGSCLESSGIPAWVGGNLGTPLSELAANPEKMNTLKWVVLEVSSYNLERIETFHPKISAILNLAPDHLSRYEDVEDYFKTKMQISRNQNQDDWIVLNADDPNLIQCNLPGNPKRIWFCRNLPVEESVYDHQGILYGKIGEERFSAKMDFGAHCPEHQVTNRISAITISMLAGANLESSIKALKEYETLPHRLQLVGEKNGIEFWNDSKATTVHAGVAAVKSLRGPVILLAGGESKEPSFMQLGQALKEKGKMAVLFGRDREIICRDIEKFVNAGITESMDKAFAFALSKAEKGDQIVLSPACASFDMFKNFEDRGNQFVELVKEIINGK